MNFCKVLINLKTLDYLKNHSTTVAEILASFTKLKFKLHFKFDPPVSSRRSATSAIADTGNPDASESYVNGLAEDAYNAHPETIPYESARYRSEGDLNGDGRIAGRSELYPLFLAAARDYTQALFVYGAPRQFRFGMEMPGLPRSARAAVHRVLELSITQTQRRTH